MRLRAGPGGCKAAGCDGGRGQAQDRVPEEAPAAAPFVAPAPQGRRCGVGRGPGGRLPPSLPRLHKGVGAASGAAQEDGCPLRCPGSTRESVRRRARPIPSHTHSPSRSWQLTFLGPRPRGHLDSIDHGVPSTRKLKPGDTQGGARQEPAEREEDQGPSKPLRLPPSLPRVHKGLGAASSAVQRGRLPLSLPRLHTGFGAASGAAQVRPAAPFVAPLP